MTPLDPSGYSFAMPLSDEEKRLLAEMEAALAVDDPKLVSTLSGKVRTPKKNRMFAGILLFFTGLVTLLAGLISQTIPVGIAGFVLALIGLVFVITNLAGKSPVPVKSNERPKKPKWSSSFEERWDRRQQENE
ncbi:MAG: DUF3040 domain-containing protein [Actinobacteria bacterium]|nr:DUF3040 domain-containing protein [Actinomycetota bacterium]